MAIRYDMHMHSSFSTDSDAPMEKMVVQALRLGLDGVCFTEHMDLDYPGRYFPEDPEAFCAKPNEVLARILQLREQYAQIPPFACGKDSTAGTMQTPTGSDSERFRIGFGLEFGMQQHLAESFHALAERYPLDFIIASQHLVSSLDPYYPDAWEGCRPEDLIDTYYQEMLANLREMKDWDTLAHMDYIIRYLPGRGEQVYDLMARHARIIDQILGHVIDSGKCLEVNTSGYKYGLGQPNPSVSILERYRQLGGRHITIGSDAHAPEHIAFSFGRTASLLQSLGFETYCIFKDRKRFELAL